MTITKDLTDAVKAVNHLYSVDWYGAEKALNNQTILNKYGLVIAPEWKADTVLSDGSLYATGTYRLETLQVTDWNDYEDAETEEEREEHLREVLTVLLDEAGLDWEGMEYGGYRTFTGANYYRVYLATPVVADAAKNRTDC